MKNYKCPTCPCKSPDEPDEWLAGTHCDCPCHLPMEKKIYFTLKTDIPPRLIGQYDGRSAEIGIAIVPAVMKANADGKVLLFEEEVSLAEDYLRTILIG